MKRILIAFTGLSLISCGSLSERQQAREGIKASEPLIAAIEKYKIDNGIYPATVQELALSDAVINEINEHKISYKNWNNQSEYGVGFRMWGPPLNPWCGYGSKTEKWQCLGK